MKPGEAGKDAAETAGSPTSAVAAGDDVVVAEGTVPPAGGDAEEIRRKEAEAKQEEVGGRPIRSFPSFLYPCRSRYRSRYLVLGHLTLT